MSRAWLPIGCPLMWGPINSDSNQCSLPLLDIYKRAYARMLGREEAGEGSVKASRTQTFLCCPVLSALRRAMLSCAACLQLKLDALRPTATYHRGASTDEEADDGEDLKKPVQPAH